MIFRRSLLRELTFTSIAIFVVLLAITFTTQIVRLLGAAAGGMVSSESILALLGFRALYYFPVLLSVTIVLSTLLTLTRAYRDSEMIVWFTSGQSLTNWLRPIAWFALPIIAMIALLSLALSPWAIKTSEEYQRILEAREDVNAISPGLFKEITRGERLFVLFVERYNPLDNSIKNFFAQTAENNKIVTMVAESGLLQEEANGDRYFILYKGRRYEGVPGTLGYRIVDFERHGLRVEAAPVRTEAPTLKALPTGTLLREASSPQQAEFFWRIGLPLNTLLLVFLTIPLAYVNPRIGRSVNLLAAILLWFISYNLLSICQAWIAQGRISVIVALFALYVPMLALTVFYFIRRTTMFTLAPSWRR